MNKPLHSMNCLGVILTGGNSSRMGQDKATLTSNGESQLTRTTKLLHKLNLDNIMISGNLHGEADYIDNIGPLGGIYTAIEKYQPKALLVVPIDLPLLDEKTLRQLKIAGELSHQAVFYQQHFLPLYLPNSAFSQHFLQQKINAYTGNQGEKQKGLSIRALLAQLPHQALTLKNPSALFNANTPQDWQRAEKALSVQKENYV